MRGIELLGVIVGGYLVYKSVQLFRKKEEDVLNFSIWLFVGVGLVISGFFPQVFTYIRKILGMEERAYTMFTLGLFISYLLIFRIFSYLRELKRDLSEINEEISLNKKLSEE